MASGWMAAAASAVMTLLAPALASADEAPPPADDRCRRSTAPSTTARTSPGRGTCSRCASATSGCPTPRAGSRRSGRRRCAPTCGPASATAGSSTGAIDEPLVYSNDVTSSFNPNGHSRFGQGDLLTEVAIIAPPPTARLGYGAGMRIVWPTAGLERDGQRQVPDRPGRRRPLQPAGDQPRQLRPAAGDLSEQRRQPEREQADAPTSTSCTSSRSSTSPARRLVRHRLCQHNKPSRSTMATTAKCLFPST